MHGFSRVLLPVQCEPPQSGVGLLHVLLSILIPSPHVLLHDPSAHELHPPSTTEQLHYMVENGRLVSTVYIYIYKTITYYTYVCT